MRSDMCPASEKYKKIARSEALPFQYIDTEKTHGKNRNVLVINHVPFAVLTMEESRVKGRGLNPL